MPLDSSPSFLTDRLRWATGLTRRCSICRKYSSSNTFPIASPSCKHARTTCAPCLARLVEKHIQLGAAVSMPCPKPSCRASLSADDVKTLAPGSALAARYRLHLAGERRCAGCERVLPAKTFARASGRCAHPATTCHVCVLRGVRADRAARAMSMPSAATPRTATSEAGKNSQAKIPSAPRWGTRCPHAGCGVRLTGREASNIELIAGQMEVRLRAATRCCAECGRTRGGLEFSRLADGCEHRAGVCSECVRRQVVEEVVGQGKCRVTCGTGGCGAVLTSEDVRRVTGSVEVAARYEGAVVTAFVEEMERKALAGELAVSRQARRSR